MQEFEDLKFIKKSEQRTDYISDLIMCRDKHLLKKKLKITKKHPNNTISKQLTMFLRITNHIIFDIYNKNNKKKVKNHP